MAEDPLLKEAKRLYRKGQYNLVLETLESRIFQFREVPDFYRVLGLSCLRIGEWNGAETYLQRFEHLQGGYDKEVQFALILVGARKLNFTDSTSRCLKILDREPQNSKAVFLLKTLKTAVVSEDPGTIVRGIAVSRILGKAATFPWAKIIAIVTVCIAVGAGGAVVVSYVLAHPFSVAENKPARPGPETVAFSPSQSPSSTPLADLQTDGTWKIQLTEDEVRSGYQKALDLFQQYRDSMARLEINRILLSNASINLKEKARALIAFLHDPDYGSFKDNVPYSKVREFPELYEGCAVLWKGVVANLKNEKTQITFDLLLGYQDGQVVEAVVPVKLNFAALLNSSEVLEVLGLVEPEKDGFVIKAVTIRELGYRKP